MQEPEGNQYHPTFKDAIGNPLYLGQTVATPGADGVVLIIGQVVSFGKKQVVVGIERDEFKYLYGKGRVATGNKYWEKYNRYPETVVGV